MGSQTGWYGSTTLSDNLSYVHKLGLSGEVLNSSQTQSKNILKPNPVKLNSKNLQHNQHVTNCKNLPRVQQANYTLVEGGKVIVFVRYFVRVPVHQQRIHVIM